jgi:hypothetical protein
MPVNATVSRAHAPRLSTGRTQSRFKRQFGTAPAANAAAQSIPVRIPSQSRIPNTTTEVTNAGSDLTAHLVIFAVPILMAKPRSPCYCEMGAREGITAAQILRAGPPRERRSRLTLAGVAKRAREPPFRDGRKHAPTRHRAVSAPASQAARRPTRQVHRGERRAPLQGRRSARRPAGAQRSHPRARSRTCRALP